MNLAQLEISVNLALPKHRHLKGRRNRGLRTMGRTRVGTNFFVPINGARVRLQQLVPGRELNVPGYLLLHRS